MKRIMTALLGVAMLMAASNAMATPVNGLINFTGALDLIGGDSLPTATSIHFVNPALVGDGGTGIYSGIPSFPSAGLLSSTLAIFKDFTYRPSMAPSPVLDLWTLIYAGNTYSFDLSSVTAITATSIKGTGTLKATGYEAADGSWQLTTHSGSGILTFAATSVPEPGTILLLGAGLLGIGFFGRRRRIQE